jgi:hypothetical protein
MVLLAQFLVDLLNVLEFVTLFIDRDELEVDLLSVINF